jgi:TonB-linked SusC/RagA family outer membrane protein
MKNKLFPTLYIFIKEHSKLLNIMKLTILLNLICLVGFSSTTYSQKQSFTLDLKNSKVREILKTIEAQSHYRFFYNDQLSDVNREINLTAKDMDIDDLLSKIFGDTDISCTKLENDIIVVAPKRMQQQEEITGKVTDAITGEPMVGVNVILEGTTTGVITDINGTYTISVPDLSQATLVFSFIGYIIEKVEVDNQTQINISLVADIQNLDEVVVVGYGIQKKETLTGSVVNVAGKELTKSPSPNVSNSLAGKLPGLIVNQRSGEPGRDDPNILIRGAGTFAFTGDNDKFWKSNAPLIIVDGVPRDLMSRLNPEDIESVSVLKDASAAIYGARAANGVILITTKKGTTGKPVFSFTLNNAFQHPTKVPKMLDAATYAEAYNEADWYRQGRPEEYTPFYSDDAIQKYRDGSDPILYPNTNWVNEVLKPYSLQQRASLQVTGGTETTRYLFSFASMNQNGDYRNTPTKYNQYNMRAKLDVDLNKNLSIGVNINAIINNSKYTVAETWINFNNILIANPTLTARYPNGLIAPGRLGENPLLNDQRGYNKTEDTPLYSTFTVTYKIPFIEGLKIDGSFNYDLRNQFNKKYDLPYYYYEYNVNTQEYDKKKGTGTSTVELTDNYSKWTTMMFNYRIAYDRTFDKHHVAAMVGQEQQKNTHKWASAYRKNFVSQAIDQLNAGSTDPDDKDNNGSTSSDAYNNYFGRFNYDFSSKYLIEFLFRYDGSQIFPEGKRYGFFPGFSAGWRLSEEEFIKDALSFVDQLKLRFSHGQIGNDRVNAYQYLQSYSLGNNYVFGTADAAGIYANTMPNPNITWEVSKKTDFGLETSLWNGLLGMDLTLWKEKRTNILAERNLSVSSILGFSDLPDENIGKSENHGFELVLSHRRTIGKLIYNISGNVAFAKSKIIYMDETPQSEEYQNQTDHPIGAGLYYQADGIFNTQEELDAYPYANGTEIGDIKVVDLNDDGEINSEDQFRFDYTSTPEYVFGLNMNFQYLNFDLSIFFQGQTNAYNYDDTFVNLGNEAFDNAFVKRAENHWSVDNPNGTMPRADAYQPGNTTFFLYDATFIRLKTLEFGYSLPEKITTKIKMGNVRLYASAYNLLTWAKEIKWSDPEISGNTLYYPQQRIINLGINVKF